MIELSNIDLEKAFVEARKDEANYLLSRVSKFLFPVRSDIMNIYKYERNLPTLHFLNAELFFVQ